jgi:hypothetical protein
VLILLKKMNQTWFESDNYELRFLVWSKVSDSPSTFPSLSSCCCEPLGAWETLIVPAHSFPAGPAPYRTLSNTLSAFGGIPMDLEDGGMGPGREGSTPTFSHGRDFSLLYAGSIRRAGRPA